MTEPKAIPFSRFGGLRLDQAIDEVGPENAIYLRDVDWDGTTGKIRPRDGFEVFATAETGSYEGLFPHSQSALLAIRRVSGSSLTLVALNSSGGGIASWSLDKAAAGSTFARFGTPSASYTYMRANTSAQKVVRFDGAAFTEPTCTTNKNPDGSGGTAGQAMPKGLIMIAWPAGDNRFVVANTGAAGGPGGAASSNSHVWFSDPGNAEAWHTNPETQAGEANYAQLSPGDGERITALAIWGSQLFAFKESKFFVFYGISEDGEGRPEFNFREVSLGEGSWVVSASDVEPSSDQVACSALTGVYFCASDGIWATTGGDPAKVSEALDPLDDTGEFEGPMADLLEGGEVAPGQVVERFRWPASGIVAQGRRIIAKRRDFLFSFDLQVGEWLCWRMRHAAIAAWVKSIKGEREQVLLCASGGAIYRMAAGTKDDAGSRLAEWQSGFYDLGAQDEKTLEGAKVWGRGKVTVAGYRDFEATADFEDGVDLGEGAIRQERAYSTQTATLFSHRLKLQPGSSVQRVVRYLRETELAAGEGAP